MNKQSIEKLYNSIINSNSLFYKLNPEHLLNEINSYNKIDSFLPETDPNTLDINTIHQGKDCEMYIVRKFENQHVWIIIPQNTN